MNATRRRTGIRAVIAIAIIALAAACQATPSTDKAGGDTAVLRLATFEGQVNDNGQNYGPQAFVDSLRKLSGGRLKVELTTDYGGNAPDAESRVVRAIASGEVDGGWPSTRAFANAGIPGLGVVEAPMTITSYAAEKALVSGPVAGKLLGRLDGTGVVGLGLTVGPLRLPFVAKAPLLGPGDWKGVRFRVFNSPVQADAVRALGATPVNLGLSFIDEISAGTLRGAEFDIPQYARSGFATQAGHVTANVVLWPKVFVLALSKKRFDALTTQQQAWVRGAAEQAVTASVDATYGQAAAVRKLCDRGVRFADATPGQIQGLRAKLRPVLERLAAKPADAQLLRDIQTIASQHPGPEKLDVLGQLPDMPPPRAGRFARFRGRSRPSPTVSTAGNSPSKTSPRREETPAITRRASGRSRCGEEPTRCTVGLSRVRVKSAAEASRTSRSRSGICGEQARSSISCRMPRDCRV